MEFKEDQELEYLLTDESFLRWYFQHNEEDMLDWEDWMADNPERAEQVRAAFQILDQLSLKLSTEQVAGKLAQLRARLKENTVEEVSVVWFRRPAFLRVAATLALLLVASFWLIMRYSSSQSGPIGAVIENTIPAAISVCKLPDGTTVRLKSGSTLRLDDNFGQQERRVYLNGEGYFEVAKDKQRPFRVVAGEVVTTAVGTAFNVRAYPDESEVKVILVEGRVRVEKQLSGGTLVKVQDLSPGKELRLNPETNINVEKIADPAATRWKDGLVLTFRNTPFGEVMAILQTNYKISIAGFEQTELSNLRITGEFDKSTSIQAIMESLAFANNFKYQQVGNHIQINQ